MSLTVNPLLQKMSLTLNPLLHEWIVINGAKRTMLQREKEDLNTIVVGNSHGDFGFNPTYFPRSFNLCCRSQDLKHSFLLYKHITINYPKIKNVVLVYSLPSPGSVLERSPSEKFISPGLNELFNLNIEYEDIELRAEFDKIKNKLGDIIVESSGISGFLPNDFKGGFPEDYGAQRKVSEHMRFNKKDEANLYLIRMLLLAKHLNHKFCIAVYPVRSDYKKATGANFNILFKSLLEILNCYHLDYYAELINGFDSDLFSDNHFVDYDHLLPLGEGTELFTKLISKKFARIQGC